MNQIASRLDNAVRVLCPDIAKRVEQRSERRSTEIGLWRELTCCVLSSQVSYQLALSATERLSKMGVFSRVYGNDSSSIFHQQIFEALSAPLNVEGRQIRYRFPKIKATQLSVTRDRIKSADIRLSTLVYCKQNDYEKRRRIMSLVCGFGPKQTSMFLRNASSSYSLAILDRHALKFMNMVGLVSDQEISMSSTLRRYEAIEGRFDRYAVGIGYPTGYVDWAVWIVMRAFGSMGRS